MSKFNVVASGDFLRADGSAVFPEFDFGPLKKHPGVQFGFLEFTQEILPRQIAAADALVLSSARVGAQSFHDGGRLALIAQFGAGFDHIDVAAATRNAVAVVNTPEGVRRPMSIAILTLIFALAMKLSAKARLVGEGPEGWASVINHNGVGLTGKILGSIGFGNIGADLFRLARPLEMKFLAYDPYASTETASALGVELVSLERVFRSADILTINCPLTSETHHLVNAERLRLMKPSAYLINTARGAVVDQKALTDALATRRLAGAGLDVFEREPLDPSDPFLALDNVILTPHALGWTDELFSGCGRDAVNAVIGFLEGRQPSHIINPDVTRNPIWRRKLASFGEWS